MLASTEQLNSTQLSWVFLRIKHNTGSMSFDLPSTLQRKAIAHFKGGSCWCSVSVVFFPPVVCLHFLRSREYRLCRYSLPRYLYGLSTQRWMFDVTLDRPLHSVALHQMGLPQGSKTSFSMLVPTGTQAKNCCIHKGRCGRVHGPLASWLPDKVTNSGAPHPHPSDLLGTPNLLRLAEI